MLRIFHVLRSFFPQNLSVANVVYNTRNSFCLREGCMVNVCPNDASVTLVTCCLGYESANYTIYREVKPSLTFYTDVVIILFVHFQKKSLIFFIESLSSKLFVLHCFSCGQIGNTSLLSVIHEMCFKGLFLLIPYWRF